jgi:predicted DNA-binding protein (MmcQ/YjbR family)
MNHPWLDDYLLAKPGASKNFKAEWGWERYVLRDKLFAAICDGADGFPVITVKCEPEFGEEMRQTFPGKIVPGHYMNKIHWNSVSLVGDVPDEIIKEMIDRSYLLILHSLPKKAQKEIDENN